MFQGGGFGPRHRGGSFDDAETLGKPYDSRVIARLPRYLSTVKAWIGIGACGIIIRSLSVLALPYLVGAGTDHFVQGDLGGLNTIAILLVVALLAMWGGQYLETMYWPVHHIQNAHRDV
jgi:hypothetical protein